MTFQRSGAAAGRRRSSGSPVSSTALFALLCAALSLHTTACKADGYELVGGGGDSGDGDAGTGGDGDGGTGGDDGGGGTIDAGGGGTIDAGPMCTDGVDADCDGEDDDCDGSFDEDVDLTSDEANCGECGNGCVAPHTIPTCNNSVCEFQCVDGFFDYDGLPGCEYQCFVSNGGVESCDLRDNDCDGQTDEDTDINTDEDNCGGCGQLCRPAHAIPECTGGICGYTDCQSGYANVDGDDEPDDVPGCEYTCPNNPPLDQEECDGLDNDCDGTVDELPIVGLGDPCSDYPEGGVGECTLGQISCDFGTPRCLGDVGPQSETCDGEDDDCDGTIDDGFNLNTDEQNCGQCGRVCNLANAVPICQSGTCRIFACLSGWVDADGRNSNGCEYQCTPTGPEVCDGVDNDCDTLTDTADPDLTAPSNFCRTAGQCVNAAPTCGPDLCGGPVQWRCVYNDPTRDEETDACGNLVAQEQDCDNRDGDCDGRIDEGDILKGTACSDGDIGDCVDTGIYVCQADVGDVNPNTNLRCNANDDDGGVGSAELCDNRDNDCDGVIDDGAPDQMVQIDDGAGGLPTFYIYKYEASKPDASATSGGTATHRSCSNPGVRPWRLVSLTEAEAACAAAGKRLCSEAEWELACSTLNDTLYPYGDAYEAQTCNGRDYDPDQDAVLPTGEADQCFADWPADDVFDMSGNLKEWTGTEVDTNAYRVRGGSYDNVKQGLTCEFDFIAFDQDVELPNLGFRCCSATP
jgi:hypothetical protein